MKKCLSNIFFFLFFFLFLPVSAEILRAGVEQTYIPKGFFGSWGVISKLNSSNNPSLFASESRDVWTLSGYNDVLILENLQSGAHSKIRIKEKAKDGKTLKFNREKVVEKNEKIIYRETVQFALRGNNFSGTDKFVVEKYDKNNVLIEKSEAKYIVEGVKISGEKPN